MNNELELQVSALALASDEPVPDSVTTIRRVERPTDDHAHDHADTDAELARNVDEEFDGESDSEPDTGPDTEQAQQDDTLVDIHADATLERPTDRQLTDHSGQTSAAEPPSDIQIEIQTDFDAGVTDVAATDTDADAVSDDELELADDELMLDSDAAARPVHNESGAAPARPSSMPPPPPLAALRAAARSSFPARTRSTTPPPLNATRAAAAASANAELLATRAELDRVARRMRARDAYLVELERALENATRQLETGRARTAGDHARLLGRARGQAFRIAELESELRQAIVALAAERASTRRLEAPNQSDLQLIRGIGPRFESQLRAMGVSTLQSVAEWTNADINRVAEQLNIRPQRIERDAWIDQARALSGGNNK